MEYNRIIPNKGMRLDVLDVETPGTQVTFALNAVLNTTEGEGVNYSSELAYKECITFDDGYIPVGHVNMERGEQLVFLSNGVTGKIGVVSNCTYTEVASSNDFPFSTSNPITGIYRLREGCQRVVFFQDHTTFDYYFNVDRPQDFQTNGQFDIRKFRLQRELTGPNVYASKLKTGIVPPGQYRFILEMLDADFNTIGFSHVSSPLYLYEKAGISVYADEISNEVDFVRLYVVQYILNSGTPAVYRFGSEIPVSSASIESTFELDYSESIADELSRFLIRPIIYDSSNDMSIVDNSLARIGPRELYIDYSDFQKAASKIQPYYKMKVNTLDNPRDSVLHRDSFPTLMPDEVYEARIVFQFPGFESPAFHIPGVAKDRVGCDAMSEYNYSTRLIVSAAGVGVDDCYGYVYFTIEYTVDGGSTQTYSDQIFDGQSIDVYVQSGAHDIVIVNFTQHTIGQDCEGLTAEYEIVVSEDVYSGTDSELITTWSSDLEFLGIENQAQLDDLGGVERWKVYNTSVKLGTDYGRPGYYECDDNYVNPYDCIDDYWGTDACGNVLEGTPIRHIRIPDRSLEPAYRTGSKVWTIGLDFTGVTYPHPDIIGHYFVIRKRTQKTILDKGFLVPFMDGNRGKVLCWLEHDNQSDDYQAFFSPYTQKGQSLDASYFKLEKLHTERRRLVFEEHYNGSVSNKDFYIASRSMYYDNYTDASTTNVSILDERILQPGAVKKTLGGNDVSNLSMNNFVHANRLAVELSGINVAAAKVVRNNMYADLFNGEYYRLHTEMKTLSSDQSCFDGDSFTSEFRIVNTVIRKIKDGIWDDILLIFAIVLGVAVSVVTAGVGIAGVGAGLSAILAAGLTTAAGVGAVISGAIGISISVVRATMDLIRQGEFDIDYLNKDDDDFDASGQVGSAYSYYASEIIENLYIDTDSNYAAARRIFDFEAGDHFIEEADVKESVIDYLYRKIAYYDEGEKRHFPKAVIVPEIYEYSKDFYYDRSAMRSYYSLPITTDFCTKCANDHPNWIVWSNSSFSDSVSDNMRTFLAENYISVGEHTGALTAIYYDGNTLWVRSKQSIYKLAPNPQVIRTDSSEAYLGTGSFLGVPASQINPVHYGYAGGQGRYDNIATEFGFVTLDVSSGRVFIISGSNVVELSDDNVAMWLRNNLPLNLPSQVQQLYGVDYDFLDTTINPYGVGVFVFYDPLFKRIIIHKRDFSVLNKQGIDYYPIRGFSFPFSDKTKFENLSFTLSYSLKERVWTSFHSYMPSWAWNNDRGQFISDGSNKLWITDEYKHGSYFGVQYPFVIEIANVYDGSYILDVIDYHSQVRRYDAQAKKWAEIYGKTFNKIWIYNEWVSMDMKDIIFSEDPWINDSYDANNVLAERSSDNYRIAGFYDIATGQPVSTSLWTYLQTYYNGIQGYMDKVVNPLAINQNPTQWELNDMDGKYHKIRLFFSNEEGYKMVVNLFNILLTVRQL